jgi:hypothetical protein
MDATGWFTRISVTELMDTVRNSRFALIALGMAVSFTFFAMTSVRMRAGIPPRTAMAKSLLDVATGAAILVVLALTLTPTGQYQAREVRLLPLTDLRSTAATHGALDALAQAGGNAALFIPLGVTFPVRWPRLDRWAALLSVAAAFSAGIEIVQVIMGAGHTTSMDDVISNTVGAALGYMALLIVRRTRRSRLRVAVTESLPGDGLRSAPVAPTGGHP